jgi:hypothetical protein
MTRTTTLGLFVPYFGQLPNYFDLWLQSCRENGDIDWILYTDCPLDYAPPTNVRVNFTSFAAFVDRIAASYDFELALTDPYKLCDFKPTYGHVFQKDLEKYEFWGFCDLDVIFGNVRKFVSEEVLQKADKVFTGGHLSLFRNDEQINRLYRTGGRLGLLDYRAVLSSPRSFAFDEWGVRHDGLNSIFLANGRYVHLSEMPYADVKVSHYALRTNREGFSLSPETAERELRKRHICYTFNRGSLQQHAIDSVTEELVQREEAYIHLQKRPMRRDPELGESPSSFTILPPNRFAPSPAAMSTAYLKRNCPERRIYLHFYRLRFRNLARLVLGKAKSILKHQGD